MPPITICKSVRQRVRKAIGPRSCVSRKSLRFVLQFGSLSPVESFEAIALGSRYAKCVTSRRSTGGFSLVELLVSVVILVILAAIAVPTLLRAYRSYQLSDAASKLSGMMKTTRFSAIRKNTHVECLVQRNGATWTVWTDLDGDLAPSPGEPQILISGLVQMIGAGSVPAPDAIVTADGTASPSLDVQSPGNATVWYDQRGARAFGGPASFSGQPAVDVFYLGNPAIDDLGFRAIVLLPSGTVQVWAAGVGGTWQRIS